MTTDQRIADLYYQSCTNTYAEIRMAMAAGLTAYMNKARAAKLDYDLDKVYTLLVALHINFPDMIRRLNEQSWLSQKACHLRRCMEDGCISESFRNVLTVLCDDESDKIVDAVIVAASDRLTVGLNVMEQMDVAA